MGRTLGRTLVFCLILIGLIRPADARRVALVIGNSAYEYATPLANPKNDANALAAALERLGFEVVKGVDLKRSEFERTVRDFARTVRGADAALLFYAGHGLQVNGRNYLAPIDAKLSDEVDLEFEALRLETVLSQMEREVKTNLVFLDACRDNPLARNLARSMGTRSASVGRGLARVDSGIGTLIAFATEPGNVALDGDGNNSPFTSALLKHIETPGLDIAQMMRRVRRDVMKLTAERQVPWNNSSLTGDFYFAGPTDQKQASVEDDGKLAALKKELEALKAQKARPPPQSAQEIIALRKELEALKKRLDRKPAAKADEEKVAVGVFPEKPKAPPAADVKRKSSRMLKPGEEFQECNECPMMVVLPPGEFTMGAPNDTLERGLGETPQHRVTIAKAFAVGKFEVTKAQFETFVRQTGHKADNCWTSENDEWKKRSNRSFRNPSFPQSKNDPVVCVDWNDAKAYVEWLSEQTRSSYRLLSEAEWEYAARAGTVSPFYTGHTITTDQANFDGRYTYNGSRKGRNRKKTVKVGTFPANAFGLHDMHGNVGEWVEDCANLSYRGAPSDGSARTDGDCTKRLNRGGAWVSKPDRLRSAYRFAQFYYIRSYSGGLRVARSLSDAELVQ